MLKSMKALLGAGGLACVMLTTPALAQEVRLGHQAPVGDARHEAMLLFAESVREKTDGAIDIQIFPDSSLGAEREMFEQVQAGVLQMALVGSIVGNFYPSWTILDMPFLWESREHILAFVDSDRGQGWLDGMAADTGVRPLAYYDRNPRILATRSTPVRSMADLAGLKVRVPDVNVHTSAWRAFGVEPVPMPSTEFYMALQLGMIDGMENPVDVMYTWNIYEVASYLSLTEHMRGGSFLVIGERFFNELPSEHQQALREAALEAQTLLHQRNDEQAEELLGTLESEGMEIIRDPDLSGFIEASRAVHQEYMNAFGQDAYDEVQALRQQ